MAARRGHLWHAALVINLVLLARTSRAYLDPYLSDDEYLYDDPAFNYTGAAAGDGYTDSYDYSQADSLEHSDYPATWSSEGPSEAAPWDQEQDPEDYEPDYVYDNW